MTREQAIQVSCATHALVTRTIGGDAYPADGFCSLCPAATLPLWTYRNEGRTANYIIQAVVDRLLKEGYTLHEPALTHLTEMVERVNYPDGAAQPTTPPRQEEDDENEELD